MENLKTSDIAEQMYLLLLSLNRKIFSHESVMKRLPIPPSHAKVIFYLIHRDNTSVSEIGKNLGISKSNMTPIIDKLISEGLVERYIDERDRRIVRVKTTQNGYEFFENQQRKVRHDIEDKIICFSEEELKILDESTKNILDLLYKMD